MQTKKEVETVVSTLALQIKTVLGNKLTSVILFGSYARGDFEEGSDVDVMVLIDAPHDSINDYWNDVADIAFELGWEHGLLISPVIQSSEIFNKYKNASGFFKNVLVEGVSISA